MSNKIVLNKVVYIYNNETKYTLTNHTITYPTPATTSSVRFTDTILQVPLKYYSNGTKNVCDYAYFYDEDKTTLINTITSGTKSINCYVGTYNLNNKVASSGNYAKLWSRNDFASSWSFVLGMTGGDTTSTYTITQVAYAKMGPYYSPASIYFTFPDYTGTKTGYTFSYWKCFGGIGTSVNYTGSWPSNYKAGGTDYWSTGYTNLGPQFYPIFTANTYTVTFDANGGSGTMSDLDCTYDTSFALPKNTFTKTGYQLKCWTDEDGNEYTDNQQEVKNLTSVNGATVTLTAQWEVETYKVTADANGGKITDYKEWTKVNDTTATRVYNYDDMRGYMPNVSRTGYTIVNGRWNDATSGGTSIWSTNTITKSMTLYAQWTANTYIVTFDANGGSVDTSSKTVTYDSTYGTLPTPTWSGHTFTGWFTNNGTQIKDTDTVKITSDTTLFAKWDAATYTITYKANGGTGSDITQTVTYGSTVTLKGGSIFSRTDYNISSWNTASNGAGTVYKVGDTFTYTLANNLTLYAQWSEWQASKVNINGTLKKIIGIWVWEKDSSGTYGWRQSHHMYIVPPSNTTFKEAHLEKN